MLLAVLVYAIGQPGAERQPRRRSSPVYLVLAAGVSASVPHRRPVQPVRGLRDDAHRELRPASRSAGAPTRCASGMTYVVISLVASTLFVTALAVRLRGDRHGEHGRPRRRRSPSCRPASRTGVRGAAARRVRHQGRRCSRCSSGCPTAIRPHPAPITAVFAGLLTKVGVYAIIRTQTLLFPTGRTAGHAAARARRAHDGRRRARRHRPGRRASASCRSTSSARSAT